MVQQKYAKHKMERNGLMDTLLIYEVNKIIKQEPIRKRGLNAGIVKIIIHMK
jgi:hypothetical protein